MIKEEFSELLTYDIELLKNEKFQIPAEEIIKLVNSGYKTVTIKILGSSKQASLNLGNSEKLFDNIKKTQSLPDNVVYDFLESKGKLCGSDFALEDLNRSTK